jgi:hypothetical protein
MLPDLTKDPDGGLTLYIQTHLPAPAGKPTGCPHPPAVFQMFQRLYWPKEAALNGQWTAPKPVKT